MKSMLSTFALVAALGFVGHAIAEDAMATPMATDAMATDAMAGDAMMSPDEVLAACLEKAGMETDTMKMDEATKACHDTHNMAGDAMAGDAMATDAMAAEPMAADAMAPAQ